MKSDLQLINHMKLLMNLRGRQPSVVAKFQRYNADVISLSVAHKL